MRRCLGTINVAGELSLSDSGNFNLISVAGGGQIILSGGAIKCTDAVPNMTLFNADNEIKGFGSISGFLLFVNNGGLIDPQSATLTTANDFTK